MSGRHRSLDDVKQAEVCALVSTGVSLRSAARYIGVDRSTIRREELRNEKFAADLRRSEMRAEYLPLGAMHSAVHRHWRAAAWLLERTRPQQYAAASRNVVKLETVHDLVEQFLEIMATELAQLPNSETACRRLKRAIEHTCRELTATAAVSRDPKRLRKVIARMSAAPPADEAEELGLICMADLPPLEKKANSQPSQEWLQNDPVAAK